MNGFLRRHVWSCAALVIASAGILPSMAFAEPAPLVTPAGRGEAFSFGLWGDMPYYKASDAKKMTALVRDINRAPLAFTVYDGDIKDGSSLCTDDQYVGAAELFNSIAVPTIYVPGDNEWTDCHRLNNGGYNTNERLSFIRRTMFSSATTFGQKQMVVEHQGMPGAAYSENTRWVYGDVVFVGVNMPGSNNNRVNNLKECTNASARTQADCDANNAEYLARDAQNVAWVRSAFEMAKTRGMRGVMVVVQGDPGFDIPETEGNNERINPEGVALPSNDGFTNFLNVLIDETVYFPGQVAFVHGDTHFFKYDKPLTANGALLQNFTRIETFGSPNVHWVKVDVNPNNPAVFSVTPMLVPGN